ncbi:MAG: biopolymer transporter Tol [Saprospiraceae bacterium]|nr:MAG: biopolymer transporter Tol [Saprospiraceae bacterium]
MKQLFLFLALAVTLAACQEKNDQQSMSEPIRFPEMEETQITFEESGHFIHTTQQFSPDDQWIVYDTRNEDPHISRTCCIEMVNVASGEIRRLYQTANQTNFGPGVGGVTFNPREHSVLFIHGLQNCDSLRPYDFSRRTGVRIRTEEPQKPIFMDGRDVQPPFTPGALRGGTHAHTWSADGQWVSFTYNDDVLVELAKTPNASVKDLRMVGVMAPLGPVSVAQDDSGENFDGQLFSVVVTEVVEAPEPGSDQIDRAYEDGWIGDNGYLKTDGSRQKRAIAFLGDVRDDQGQVLSEVFVVDVPDDITAAEAGKPIEGTNMTRPMPPAGTTQRRLTFTGKRRHPGVQGPRHWLRSSPDGSVVFFMMKDEGGIVQIYGVSPNGGEIQQITKNDFSIATSFNVSPDGKWLCYGSQERVFVTEISSGLSKQVSPDPSEKFSALQGINWSNDGKMIVYNRKVETGGAAYYQVFLLKPKGSSVD